MNAPFLFDDFTRALAQLQEASEHKDRYVLLTGESGSGKTTLLRTLRGSLDRVRYRCIYFQISRLSPAGLVRCLARSLRIAVCRSQPETVQAIARVLHEDVCQTLLWCDEAQLLPDETFAELRTLAETDLAGDIPISVFLCGLPPLREHLQAPELFPLWRRLTSRVELTGLRHDEARPFAEHHLGENSSRIQDETLSVLFEQARGVPGVLQPYLERTLREAPEGPIPPDVAEAIIQRYEMP